MTTKKDIQILVVEDMPADVVMVNHELRKGGLKFRSKRVDSREAFLEELKHDPPDLILSDHGVPSFGGFAALAIAQDKCPDVPFIFVTNALGEQKTIEAFESGATDYVLKSQLARLVPVVQRALCKAEAQMLLKQQIHALSESDECFRVLADGKQRDEKGRLPGVAQVKRNLTPQNEAAEALRKSEALNSAILATALDAIISIDHEGLVQEWNPAAERIFGYTRSEAVTRPMDELIVPPALLQVYKDGLTDYLITGVGSLLGRPVEMTLRRADGTEFRAEMAITRLPTEEPPRCTALIRDITARKQAEAALRESEERFRLMVEQVKDYAIYMLDAGGRVATWNVGAERLQGYRAEEVIGKPQATFFTAEDVAQGVPEQVLTQAKQEGKTSYEGWRVRKDGTRFWMQGIVTAVRDETGKLYGFAKVAHDMTERKKAEEMIWELNTQLERRVLERTAQLETATDELEAFSYSVSHDLQAPLRHVAAYVEILRHEAATNLSLESKEYLERIVVAAGQLDHLINALLSFSRVGRAEMREQRVSLAALVEEAQACLRPETEDRNIAWQIGKLPEVDGDTVMLRQVILILLSNALKFTRPRSETKIEIGALDGKLETIVFIRDNGVGFDMKCADNLFGVFQRLHPASEFEGTGIGLANVRRIVRRHGGRVWAEAAVGDGATFYCSLPKLRISTRG